MPVKDQKPFWEKYESWSQAEDAWEQGQKDAKASHPLKVLKTLPQMPGITKETKPYLRLKGLRYLLTHPEGKALRKYVLKHPIKYTWNYLKSLFRKTGYTKRSGDFYFYGLSSKEQFLKKAKAKNSLIVVGFSYCEKPLECPAKRFSSDCIRDPENPVCRQCFIGKSLNTLPPKKTHPLVIPTSFYIGEQIFDITEKNPDKEILFVITACEMTLEMFGDWGNAAQAQGIGVRLDGRICNTWKAFELSEEGIKPGLTIVLPKTEEELLKLFKALHDEEADSK